MNPIRDEERPHDLEQEGDLQRPHTNRPERHVIDRTHRGGQASSIFVTILGRRYGTLTGMSDSALRRLAWVIFTVNTVVLAVGLVLEWFARSLNASNSFGQSGVNFLFTILFSLLFWMFPVAGMAIAARVPRNPIGWLLLAIGMGWGTLLTSAAYGDYGLKLHPGSLPAAEIVASLGLWIWAPPVAITGVFLLLVYPDGHLPSPRWRWVAYLCGAAVVICVLTSVLMPGPMDDAGFSNHQNPFGVTALEPVLSALQLTVLLIPVCMVAAVISLVRRFRRSGAVERLQIKWLAAAGGISGALYAVSLVLGALLAPSDEPDPGWLTAISDVWIVTVALIPLSIVVAILRYRLFEIERDHPPHPDLCGARGRAGRDLSRWGRADRLAAARAGRVVGDACGDDHNAGGGARVSAAAQSHPAQR